MDGGEVGGGDNRYCHKSFQEESITSSYRLCNSRWHQDCKFYNLSSDKFLLHLMTFFFFFFLISKVYFTNRLVPLIIVK